jgi:hypothetical protein
MSDAGIDGGDSAVSTCTLPASYSVLVHVMDDESLPCDPTPDEVIQVDLPLETVEFVPGDTSATVTRTGPCSWAVHGFYNPIEGTITVDGTVEALEARRIRS